VNTSQQIALGPFAKIHSEIDRSSATKEEKAAAKSFIQKITENPLLNTIFGAVLKG
jgi:hypothetical protein